MTKWVAHSELEVWLRNDPSRGELLRGVVAMRVDGELFELLSVQRRAVELADGSHISLNRFWASFYRFELPDSLAAQVLEDLKADAIAAQFASERTRQEDVKRQAERNAAIEAAEQERRSRRQRRQPALSRGAAARAARIAEAEHFVDRAFTKCDAIALQRLWQDRYDRHVAAAIRVRIEGTIENLLTSGALGAKLSDKEKVRALANFGRAVLLRARAGSGKTMTIALRVALLVKVLGIPPQQVMVLAFNRKAASEIRKRIQESYRISGFDNARTFHSLAYAIVQPEEELLFDEDGSVFNKRLSAFVQDCLRVEWNAPVRASLLDFFRQEVQEIDSLGVSKRGPDYLLFRRNLTQISLRGEAIKSIGEKWIADFLFEHQIPYTYEKIFYMGNRLYRPDFCLYINQTSIIIEHWGIDEFDSASGVPASWDRSWQDYRLEMEHKRAFWKARPRDTFLETSVRDMRKGREAFLARLAEILTQAGVPLVRLSDQDLLNKVMKSEVGIGRITTSLTQFITRARKAGLTSDDVARRLAEAPKSDRRTTTFENLALCIFRRYEQRLAAENKVDFDMLLERCACELMNNFEHHTIPTRHGDIAPADLRYLFVDEYQDFSRGFMAIINALRAASPDLQVFCVGDDWQAINGFAGSELRFIDRFYEYHRGGEEVKLLTNHRSAEAIVNLGNTIMVGRGAPAQTAPGKCGGNTTVEWMDDVWIEQRNDATYAEARSRDELYTKCFGDERPDLRNSLLPRYLKRMVELVGTHPEQTIMFLCRTNRFYGETLTSLANAFRQCFPPAERHDIGRRVQFLTAHKSKGLQADVVAILGATARAFPLVHPDETLFRIFGKSADDVIAEERRLFYVACTRAKQALYILTERDEHSDFIPADLLTKRPRSTVPVGDRGTHRANLGKRRS